MTGEHYATADFRNLRSWGSDERVSYRETLAAMVKGRNVWHSRAEWDRIAADAEGMTEEQAEAIVRQIMRERDSRIAQ